MASCCSMPPVVDEKAIRRATLVWAAFLRCATEAASIQGSSSMRIRRMMMRGPGHSTSAAIIRPLAPAMRAPVSEHVQSHAAAGALSQAGLASLGSEPCRAQADHQGFPIRGSPVTISAVSIWLCTDSTARSTAVRRQVLAAAIASRSRISGEPHTCTAALTMRL